MKNEKAKDWESYDQTISRFIQVIAKNMELYGITHSVGRLYGVLYFSDEPMTLDDMTEALKMSKTSMSTGVRTLKQRRMVESTFRKGVRKDLYESEEDWFKSFTALFGDRWRYLTETNIDEATDAIEQLEHLLDRTQDERLQAKIKADLKRLQDAQSYYKWLIKFIKTVESGEIFELIPRE